VTPWCSAAELPRASFSQTFGIAHLHAEHTYRPTDHNSVGLVC
jgi:hypothetical protein